MDALSGRSLAGHWRARPPVVRSAGLPSSALRALRSSDVHRFLDEALSTDAEVHRRAVLLAARLHTVIGEGSGPLRSLLVGLRRCVHGRTQPAQRLLGVDVRAALPATELRLLDEYLDALQRRSSGHAALAEAVTAAGASVPDHLCEQVSDPMMRRALALASPSLLDTVEKWIRNPRRRPQRQKLVRLAKYVARAAAKTSPFSTFTVSSPAQWVPGGELFDPGPVVPTRGVLDADGAFLARTRAALAEDPQLRDTTALSVNPSATVIDGKITFLGSAAGEPLWTLAVTPLVQVCLDRAARAGTLGGLVSELASTLNHSRADVQRLVGRLTDAGLLQATPPVPDHAARPWRELAGWLHDHRDSELAEVCKLLDEMDAELARDVPVADVPAHRARCFAVQRAAASLADRLGIAPPAALHETAVAPGMRGTCGADAWRAALADLDVVRRWIPVFDPALALRALLGPWVRARFGAGARVPFVALHEAVQHELAEGTRRDDVGLDLRELLGAGAVPWSAPLERVVTPRLRELAGLRAAAAGVAEIEPDRDGVRRLDPLVLAQQIAQWPDWLGAGTSSGCYVQPSDRGLVLNVIHGGDDRGTSRLRQLWRRAGGDLDSPVLQDDGADPVSAELGGLLSSGLNVRERGAPYEIEYPGSVPVAPPRNRLPLADLVIEHDPERDDARLTSTRLGRRVRPLHLGMSSDFTLPRAAAFLVRALGSASLLHPTAPPLIPLLDGAPPAEPVHHPRVEVGRVVLQRARWLLPTAALPRRRPGTPDLEHLVELGGALRELGVPPRMFVRAWGGEIRGDVAKARKPVYVDLAAPLLVAVFEQVANGSALVIIDEALPDPSTTGDRVVEFFVELSDDEVDGG